MRHRAVGFTSFAAVAALALFAACAETTPPPAPPPTPDPTPAPTTTAEPPAAASTTDAPPVAAPPKDNFTIEQGALKLPGPVVFETGTAKLKPESDEVLAYVARYLEAKPDITLLRVEGHSDNEGPAGAAQKLTEARSLAVARWLVAKGIDCKRLVAVGFGPNKPVTDNSTPEGRAANRRVVFANAMLRGRAIGGMPTDGGGNPAGDACK